MVKDAMLGYLEALAKAGEEIPVEHGPQVEKGRGHPLACMPRPPVCTPTEVERALLHGKNQALGFNVVSIGSLTTAPLPYFFVLTEARPRQ